MIVILNKAIFMSLENNADESIREVSEVYGFRLPYKASAARIEYYVNYLCGCQFFQSYGKDICEDDTSLCERIGKNIRKNMDVNWEVYDTNCDLTDDLTDGHFLTDRYIWADIRKYGCKMDVKKGYRKKIRKTI